MKTKTIVALQAVALILIAGLLYALYPRSSVDIHGNAINFVSENANIIVLSKYANFSEPRYLVLEKGKNLSLNLKPGKYYWKAENNYLGGLAGEFSIDSEVGLGIENETDLVNLGNVIVNVSKSKEGVMIGHVILEPDASEKINDSVTYVGRQNEEA